MISVSEFGRGTGNNGSGNDRSGHLLLAMRSVQKKEKTAEPGSDPEVPGLQFPLAKQGFGAAGGDDPSLFHQVIAV